MTALSLISWVNFPGIVETLPAQFADSTGKTDGIDKARAVYESAQDALNTIDDLIRLHEKHFDAIKTTGKSVKTIIKVFEYLERSPIIEIKKTSQELDLAFNTVSNAVTRLAELGILSPVRNVRRSRIFAYDDYLAILRKNT